MNENDKYLDKHILIKGRSMPEEKEDGENGSRNSAEHLSPPHLVQEKSPTLCYVLRFSFWQGMIRVARCVYGYSAGKYIYKFRIQHRNYLRNSLSFKFEAVTLFL